MAERNLTPTDLHQLIGGEATCNDQTVRNFLAGKTAMRCDVLAEIFAALQIDVIEGKG